MSSGRGDAESSEVAAPPSSPSVALEPLRRQQHMSLQQAHVAFVDRHAGRARLYEQWKQLLESFEDTYGNHARVFTRAVCTRPSACEDSDSSSDEGETTWTLSEGYVKPKPTGERKDSPSDIMSLERNSRSVAGAGPAMGWTECRAATAPTTIISTQSLSGALSATLLNVRQTRGQWEAPAERTAEKISVASVHQESEATMVEAATEEEAKQQAVMRQAAMETCGDGMHAVQVGTFGGYEVDASSSDDGGVGSGPGTGTGTGTGTGLGCAAPIADRVRVQAALPPFLPLPMLKPPTCALMPALSFEAEWHAS